MTGQLIKSNGGFLLAVKNIEGDILSEVVANAYATHGLMYNEVKGRNGEVMFETNHGTLSQHYENYISGQPCVSNPSATIYVWAKALHRRAIVDHNQKLEDFADSLIKALHQAVDQDGKRTRDIAIAINRDLSVNEHDYVKTDELINQIRLIMSAKFD